MKLKSARRESTAVGSGRKVSLLKKVLCDIFELDTNYSLFIAGIIASIPATLLLNLASVSIAEVQYKWLYGTIYIITFVASLFCCFAMFRFAVRHIEVRGAAEAEARENTGTREEFENAVLAEVNFTYIEKLRPVVHRLLWSAGVTVVGILALFVLMNIKF